MLEERAVTERESQHGLTWPTAQVRDSRGGLVHTPITTSSESEAEVGVLEVAEPVDGVKAADLIEGPAPDEKTGACEEVDDARDPILVLLGAFAIPVASDRPRPREHCTRALK